MGSQAAGRNRISGDGGSHSHHASLNTINSAARYNGPRVFWVE